MTSLRLLLRLLFYRPLILVLLTLVYTVAALLVLTVDPSKSGLAVAAMASFAAAGLAAVLTERITRHSLQAGVIGLPDHARMMRRVQGWFLAMFLAAPAALASLLGVKPLAAIAALSVATAAGILVAAYGVVWLIAVPLLGRIIPLSKWASEPFIQALAVVGGAYLIWRWFDLPSRGERAGAVAHARLADARHERRKRAVTVHDPAPYGGFAAMLGGASPGSPPSDDLGAIRQIAAVLALGLGYSLKTTWRSVLYGFGIAVGALAAWRALHGENPEPLGYVGVTAVCCLSIVWELQRVLQRWMHTGTEQALLCLMPRWPRSRLIKQAVIVSTLMVQRGAIVVWASASAVGVVLGWIDPKELYTSMLALIGTSLAFTAAAWALLAQRRIRGSNPPTIVSVLVVGAGALMVLLSALGLHEQFVIGVLFMLAPPALAFAWYGLAPLRFPLSVDPRALKTRV